MKKIYTLIALAAFTFSATAQADFAVNLVSHTVGDTDDSDPLLFQFEVENVGSTTMAIDDTIFVGLSFDGAPLQVTLVGGFTGYFLTEELGPGDVFTVPDLNIDWLDQDVETTIEVCAMVYGSGVASIAGPGPTALEAIAGDDDITNNSACISAVLPVGVDDASIEGLNLNLSNVYVTAEQLVIVNDGSSDNVQANLNIVNMNGQIVQTENFVLGTGTSFVNLNNLNTGIYIVAIETEKGVVTKKISIQ